MPRVLSYTPKWLAAPSSGADLFIPAARKMTNGNASLNALGPGPYRTIAYRGTEIFVAVGSELRWADLVYTKEQQEQAEGKGGRGRTNGAGSEPQSADEPVFKTIKLTTNKPITQLALSHDGSMLAVATATTIQALLLPSSHSLSSQDSTLVRPKSSFTIGPTTHVSETSPVVSVLWHPLSAVHNCLITITESAEVRLWELNTENLFASSEEPALSLDLNKLAGAETSEDDVNARPYSKGQLYSVDDLHIAAACFGSDGESATGWADMTLYVATVEGEVYAICPLLPSQWRYEPGVFSSLSLEVAARKTELNEDSSEEERLNIEQLSKWIANIETQDVQETVRTSTKEPITVFSRPTKPDLKPKLQGPLFLEDETLEDDEDITDIHVIKLQINGQHNEEDSEEELILEDDSMEELHAAFICLGSDKGSVHVALDLEGIEPQWLPPASKILDDPEDTARPLTVYESITIPESTSRVLITPDVQSPGSFFITHEQGVVYVSLELLPKLVAELAAPTEKGSSVRIDTLLSTSETLVEKVLAIDTTQHLTEASTPLAAAIVLKDSDLGWMLLTSASSTPYAVFFDDPDATAAAALAASRTTTYDPSSAIASVTLPETRPAYNPNPVFRQRTNLLNAISAKVPARRRGLLSEQIVLSPATLDIFTEAHRVLAHESHAFGVAVADLFRRCERLRDELADQVSRVSEIHERVAKLAGVDVASDDEAEDEEADDAASKAEHEEGALVVIDNPYQSNIKLDRRLRAARSRQHALVARADELRRKLEAAGISASHGGLGVKKPLSDREKAYVADMQRFAEQVEKDSKLVSRVEEVKRLKGELVPEAKAVAKADADEDGKSEGGKDGLGVQGGAAEEAALVVKRQESKRVPVEVRRAKKREVELMLERQEALVEAAREKLERLGVAGSL